MMNLYRTVVLVLIVFFTGQSRAGAQSKELWVYAPANFLLPEQVASVETLMTRAKAVGYTHFLVSDSKFSRLAQMDKRYFDNIHRLQTSAKKLGIQLVTAVHPVGYSNDLLSLNPNLAEGLPVKNAIYVVKGQQATVDRSVLTTLPKLSDRKAWGFIDESFQIEGESLRTSAPHSPNTRLMMPIKVTPFQHYHVSIQVKTEGFDTPVEIKALTSDGKSLCYTHLQNQPTQNWTEHHVTFNSLDNAQVNLYFGAWGPTQGKLWLRQPKFETAGAVNLLRRSTTPISVQWMNEQGEWSPLIEGRDFQPWADQRLGVIPYEGEYEVWHDEPPILLNKKLPEGAKLSVSYFHTHVIHAGQVCGAINTAEFEELLIDQSKRMTQLFPQADYFMSHDEYRLMGWTQSSLSGDSTKVPQRELPSYWLTLNAKKCFESLKQVRSNARVFVWSDMFDPHHNAVDQYYLVQGTLEKATLPKEVIVMNWNSPKRLDSLRHFADLGHHQLIAGYYDTDANEISGWLDTVVEYKVPNVDGVMYTTWNHNYSDLETFASKVKSHVWYSNK